VLLVGPQVENRPAVSASADLLIVESAPHELLFPRAAAVVHHGGVGTTGQALRSGHPMLIAPFAHDQPDNAYRASRLGVARVLYPGRYTAPRVASHLDELLGRGSYANRAQAVGRSVRADAGVDTACEEILALHARAKSS
jgi:UDP:flavonoid glycosyltransferase YjiC (YdhE family)